MKGTRATVTTARPPSPTIRPHDDSHDSHGVPDDPPRENRRLVSAGLRSAMLWLAESELAKQTVELKVEFLVEHDDGHLRAGDTVEIRVEHRPEHRLPAAAAAAAHARPGGSRRRRASPPASSGGDDRRRPHRASRRVDGPAPALVRGVRAAGIDIRPNSWDVHVGDVHMVKAPGASVVVPTVRLVFAGKLEDEVQALHVLRQYRVRAALCDSRPDAMLAQRFQRSAARHHVDFWRANYATNPTDVELRFNEAEKIVTVARTMTLDAVQHCFMTRSGVALPQNLRDLTGGQFVREMTCSTRVPTVWQGREDWKWEESGPDHAFHAFNYLMIAVRIGKLDRVGTGLAAAPVRGTVERTLEANLDDDEDELAIEAGGATWSA